VSAWAVLGVVTAAAFYVRPVALILPVLLLIHEATRPRVGASPRLPAGALAARVAVLGAVVAMLLAPWAIRNQRIYGAFLPASSAAALPMVQGRLIARGLPVPAETIPQLADLAPFDYDDHAYAERTAVALAAAIPPASAGDRLASAIRRLGMLAQAFTSPFTFFSLPVPVLSWGFAMQSGLLALAALGAWRRRRDRRALVLIAGVPVGFAIAYWWVAILWSRYLYPAMPLVLALAGAGAASLVPAPRRGPGAPGPGRR
jgi:hypothetical protein